MKDNSTLIFTDQLLKQTRVAKSSATVNQLLVFKG